MDMPLWIHFRRLMCRNIRKPLRSLACKRPPVFSFFQECLAPLLCLFQQRLAPLPFFFQERLLSFSCCADPARLAPHLFLGVYVSVSRVSPASHCESRVAPAPYRSLPRWWCTSCDWKAPMGRAFLISKRARA